MDGFPDRREQLFGRDRDIDHLVDRARLVGLTAIVARPLMGKTWTLSEVARRLLEDGRHLVGYHESTGGESSHLLYAVSNLYTRWLTDSALREQAISLWERHKEGLVPRIGQLVGAIFEKLGAIAPCGIAGAVRAAFDGLAEAQKDLRGGGLQMPILPYDQALSLTRLVAKVSGRRIVLILDAWEKSPSLRTELGTLEGILKHIDAWADTHVLLGVRTPEVDSTKINVEAYRRARDLCRLNRTAEVYELPLMDQTGSNERMRVVEFVRRTIPAAESQTDQTILDTIDGYPGVLDFWTSEAICFVEQTWNDCLKEARNAHALRYIELDHLLAGLSDGSRAMAARLAFFPRLDAERWILFRDILLQDQPIASIETLVDSRVLIDESFPTYGHDTRHAAARRYFTEHWRALVRRTSEMCVSALAARITGVNSESRPYYEVLVACSETAREVRSNSITCCLLDAAQSAFGDCESSFKENFDGLCKTVLQRDPRFTPLIVQALLNRGFIKSRRGDSDGAMAHYTAAIELPNASAEHVAHALLNRGFIKSRRGDSDGAMADYTTAIEMPNAPVEHVAHAHLNRGFMKCQRGDGNGEMADYTAAIELPNAPAEHVAHALFNRGVRKGQRGDGNGAMADYTAAIELPNAPAEHVAHALFNRGVRKGQRGDGDGEMADYTAAIELPNAPAEWVANALVNCGVRRGAGGDSDGEMADYTAAIELPNAPAERVAHALFNRGAKKGQRGDRDGEMADYTAAIELPNAPAEWVANALVNRGVRKGERGDSDGEMADCTAAIELPNAPAEQVAKAFSIRAITKGERGDRNGAMADYTSAIGLPNAPAEVIEAARRILANRLTPPAVRDRPSNP